MDDSAGCRGGFNSIVVGRKEQGTGHLEAYGGTDYESADEENCEGLGKVDDQETDDQRDEAAAKNILMELLLKGVENQAAEHTADEEYSHCSAGEGCGAQAALGDDEGDVRTHDAIGVDEHENDRAEQPGDGGNLEVALLAVCLSRLVCGEIDTAENQRDKRVKESEIGVVPSLCSKNAADEGQVHAAAVCKEILNAC